MSALSSMVNASTWRALNSVNSVPPKRRRAKNSSTSAMLSAVIWDFGQYVSEMPFRAHTSGAFGSSRPASHPHRRFRSRPDRRHASHFQPAWLEN
jgi:hypothetical protein